MNRLKEIKSIQDLKDFVVLNKESIKKAALPVTVAVAILFFWLSGASAKNDITETNISEESNNNSQYEEYEDLEEAENITNTAPIDIYVDIGGCVKNPGVYKVDEGTRLFQLIERAGGLTEDADTDNINQAEAVYDGQKVMIYPKSEDVSNEYSYKYEVSQGLSDKININRADSSELQEIPGVGPATAQKIIEYRDSIGRFKTIEELKNVSGIGDKTFEKLKAYITV